MDKKHIITKSKYLNGLKCYKLFWIDCNDRARIPSPDIAKQHIFDQGNAVGELAKELYPGGIDVPYERGKFFDNIEETKELLPLRKTLFEAGILAGDIYSRIDILRPSAGDMWDIIEVKSSTGMKDTYLDDLAFQKYCCEENGMKIDRCLLVHINNGYVKDGDIDPGEFFEVKDVTGEIEAYSFGIESRVQQMRELVSEGQYPEVEIGLYCEEPYECALKTECRAKLPADNIFTLYNYGPKKGFALLKNGVESIRDIPAEDLGVKQLIQKTCEETGKTHIDKEAIKAFLESIEYPVDFMDFETINPAVPLFDGTRPYQQIPFQFSVHVLRSRGAALEHHGFLSKNKEDPREKLLAALKRALGEEGTIIVYNRGFEERILTELADSFPEYGPWVQSIKKRIIDLLVPFRGFDYYNPTQKGSASIKQVLPAVTGKGYEGMDIAGGGEASVLYFKVTYRSEDPDEKEKVYCDLEKYCALDTEGMVWLLEELKRCADDE